MFAHFPIHYRKFKNSQKIFKSYKNMKLIKHIQIPYGFRLNLKMRLTITLLLFSLLRVNASGYSQNTKITLDLQNVSVFKVLDEIQNLSEFSVYYRDSQIDLNRKVSISVQKEKIKKILNFLFANTNVGYQLIDKNIILNDKTKNKFSPKVVPINTLNNQQIKISGFVKDKSGTPLPGVNIVKVGTIIGTDTDFDGKYSIAASKGDQLTFSYLGMKTVTITIESATTINITMENDAATLDEIVVVGYGTSKKKDLTGAVGSVDVEDVSVAATTSIDAALSGRVSGLVAVATSGQPGAGASVQIRGNASFASAGVLYVVDGVPINGGAGEPGSGNIYSGASRSSLNFINPNDIESIQVLKDASSAAIYGARAGSGVILITTKKGKIGKAKVSFDQSYAYQNPLDFYKVHSEQSYMINRNGWEKERWLLDNKIGVYGATDPSTVSPFVPRYSENDIQGANKSGSALDAIQRNGYLEQYNVSVSGGDENTRYFISGNLTDQKGVLINSGLDRFTGRINFSQKLSNKFKVGVNLNTSITKSENPAIGEGRYENAGMILSAFYHPPTVPLINEDGTYPLNPEYKNAPNPLSFREITDGTVSRRLLTNAYLDYKIMEPLTLRVRYSYDQSTSKRKNYLPKTFLYGMLSEGEANILQNETDISLVEYTASYNKSFDSGSSLSGVVGYSYQERNGEGFNAGNKKFLTDNFLYNNLWSGTAERPSVGSYRFKEVWASYFGRVTLNYIDKYILTGSIRRDGSSKFAKNKKFGLFPSVSAAWKISSEDFMKDSQVFEFLKVRANYGTTGNSNIGSSAFSLYAPGGNYVFGNNQSVGVYLKQLENADLTWETARELNFGLDFSILNGKVSGSIDYFNKTISDLLDYKPLPLQSVVSGVAANIGKTQSKGWELSLSTKNIENDNFSWKTDFNIAHFKDTWKERSPEVLKVLPKYIGEYDELRAIYGYVTDGVLKVGEEVPVHMPGLSPGMIRAKDLNGFDEEGNLTGIPDGILNSADQIKLGNSDPGYTFGFSNVFKYKNLDLNIFAYGMLDRLLYNNDKSNAFGQMFNFGWNTLEENKDRWSSENQSSNLPSGLPNPYGNFVGNFFRENGAFLRVKSITLGYNLPEKLLDGQKFLSSARFYVDVQNPFVITSYSGLDPEVSGFVAYPPQKSFVVGMNINF